MPAAFVKNGEIVLNISASATRRLTIDNDGVQFNARFSGVSQEVSVPMSAVAGDLRQGDRATASRSPRRSDPAAALAAATAPPEEPSTPAARRRDADGSGSAKATRKADDKPQGAAVAPAGHQVAAPPAATLDPCGRRARLAPD